MTDQRILAGRIEAARQLKRKACGDSIDFDRLDADGPDAAMADPGHEAGRKHCPCCGHPRPADEFYRERTGRPSSHCVACQLARGRRKTAAASASKGAQR